MTRAAIDPAALRRLLVIKLRHIGDVLLLTPTLRAFKAARPDLRLSVLVRAGTEEMLTLNPDVDEVLVLPREATLAEEWRLVRTLRARRFDAAVCMTEGDHGVLLALLSGAPLRVGIDPHGRGLWGKRRLLTQVIPCSGTDTRPRAVQDMDVLRPFGIAPGEALPALYTAPAHRERVAALLTAAGLTPRAPYAVVHPASRWRFKCWRDRGVAEVMDTLETRGLRVVLSAGPDAVEAAQAERIRALVRRPPLLLAGALSLKELAALIGGARLFFGVDSAPMHMAAALGTPLVALFGPSDARVWGPSTARGRVIAKTDRFDCIPCKRDGCEGSKRSRCLEAITAEEVVAAIDAVLNPTTVVTAAQRP